MGGSAPQTPRGSCSRWQHFLCRYIAFFSFHKSCFFLFLMVSYPCVFGYVHFFLGVCYGWFCCCSWFAPCCWRGRPSSVGRLGLGVSGFAFGCWLASCPRVFVCAVPVFRFGGWFCAVGGFFGLAGLGAVGFLWFARVFCVWLACSRGGCQGCFAFGGSLCCGGFPLVGCVVVTGFSIFEGCLKANGTKAGFFA